MSDIIYLGARYVLHTAAAVTPKPDDWETNKAQYIAEAVSGLENLAEYAQELNVAYNVAPDSPGEIKKDTTTGKALDFIIARIDTALENVQQGNYTFSFLPQAETGTAKHMNVRAPQRPTKLADTTTTLDCVNDLTVLLNQWEEWAGASRKTPKDKSPEELAQEKAVQDAAKADVLLPKYVETYMARMNENVADIWATLKRKNETAENEAEKLESEQILGSFANFMQMLKVVSDALANGETIVLSQGLTQTDTEGKLEVERPIKDVVKELWLEFRHYLLESRKQKAQEKAKAKPAKEPKAPKEPKPSNLLEITQELIATIQDIQNKNPQYLLQPKVREGFNKLKADAVAVGQAVEAGATSVKLSTGDYPIADAVKLIQDGVAGYKRMMQKELAPQARDQAKQEKQTGALADLDANIARVEAEMTQLKAQQSTLANRRLEELQDVKRTVDPARKQRRMQSMQQLAQQLNNLRYDIDKLQNERSSLVLARDNLLKKTRPVPVSQPEVTAPAGIVQTPEF